MEIPSTETRPSQGMSWRRVLVASIVTLLGLGFIAGFFIWQKGASTEEVGAALTSVFHDIFGSGVAPEPILIPYKEDGPGKEGDIPVAEINSTVSTPKAPQATPKKTCPFETEEIVEGSIKLSEVAWMGTEASSEAEWMELANMGETDESLSGWRLLASNGTFVITFNSRSVIPAKGVFILERKDDSSLPTTIAGQIFDGRLSNGGVHLRLFDEHCRLRDELDSTSGWNKLGGDTITKRTAERDLVSLAWHSSLLPQGTPGVPFFSDGAEKVASVNDGTIPHPSVFIREVMVGKEGNAGYEFVELFNPGQESVKLSDWSLKKISGTGAESSLVSAALLADTVIAPAGILLLAGVNYDGQPAATVTWPKSYSLAYKSNGLVLYGPNGAIMDKFSWSEIDPGRSEGRTGQFNPGTSQEPSPGH